jgi:hypothetical protein
MGSSNQGSHPYGGPHWCKKADLKTVGSSEADRCGPQELVKVGIGPTSGIVIPNKSGKKLLSVAARMAAK